MKNELRDEGEKALLLLLLLALLAIILLGEEKELPPALERTVKKLEERRFTRSELEKIFSDPRLEFFNDIGKLKKKKVDYFEAAFGLFSLNSIARGREFLSENKIVLEKAEQQFQVSKEVIVAILRLETNFGNFVGRRRLVSTFYSMLISDFRVEFAEKEMINLLLMARKNHEDPFNYYGSYMGAFGLCQFLPSSYLHYAADGDSDGKVDLNNVADAVMSIAHYLRAHGWKKNDFYRQKEALYSYNRDVNYVVAVLMYANFLK